MPESTLGLIVEAYLTERDDPPAADPSVTEARAEAAVMARLCRQYRYGASVALFELRLLRFPAESLGLASGEVDLLDAELVKASQAAVEAERQQAVRRQELRNRLEHETDGPVTAFVLLARAARVAHEPAADPSEVANALHDVLRERGLLNDDE